MNTAATGVCRDLEPGRQLAMTQVYAACMHDAIANAVAEIDRPVLTAYAASRGFSAQNGAITLASSK